MKINKIERWDNDKEDVADEDKFGCKILIGTDGTIYEMYEDPKSHLQFITEVFGKYTVMNLLVNNIEVDQRKDGSIKVSRGKEDED